MKGRIAMREILFRGKRKDNGKWIQGSLLRCSNGAAIIAASKSAVFTSKTFAALDDAMDAEPETVGQFTGEKEFTSDEDGNVTRGKRIFDGDIVRIESTEDGNGEFLVAWDDEKGGWQFKHLRGTRGTDCPDAVKVIGNRWDNPELLGAGK